MFRLEAKFHWSHCCIITVEQQLIYEIFLHRILTKLSSFSHFLFTQETPDLAVNYRMADVVRTDQISGLLFFTDGVQVTPFCFTASVYQAGKVSLSNNYLSCRCTNPAVATTKGVRNQEHKPRVKINRGGELEDLWTKKIQEDNILNHFKGIQFLISVCHKFWVNQKKRVNINMSFQLLTCRR